MQTMNDHMSRIISALVVHADAIDALVDYAEHQKKYLLEELCRVDPRDTAAVANIQGKLAAVQHFINIQHDFKKVRSARNASN